MKEMYSFKEAQGILRIGNTAFKTMVDKGDIKAYGRRVSRAEIEKVLGHPIEQPTAATADDKMELYKRQLNSWDELNKSVVALKRQQEQLQTSIFDAETKLKETKRDINFATKDLENIQAKIDARMAECDNEISGRKAEVQEKINESLDMAHSARSEADAKRQEATKLLDTAREKAELIIQSKSIYDNEVAWVEKFKILRDGIERTLGGIKGVLANREHYTADALDNVLGEYMKYYEFYVSKNGLNPLPYDGDSEKLLNEIKEGLSEYEYVDN